MGLGYRVRHGRWHVVDNRETLSTSLHECLERYVAEIVPLKKWAKRDLNRVKSWQRESLAKKGIGTMATNLRRDSEFVIPAGMPESSHTDVKL